MNDEKHHWLKPLALEEDESKIASFLELAYPYIGKIVVEFNLLEGSLKHFALECASPNIMQDEKFGVFLAEMRFSAVVKAFDHLLGLHNTALELGITAEIREIHLMLEDAARRRNLYVHAAWSEPFEGSRILVRTEVARDGISDRYVRMDEEKMKEDLAHIESVGTKLDTFWFDVYEPARAS